MAAYALPTLPDVLHAIAAPPRSIQGPSIPCKSEDCAKAALKRGLCRRHYGVFKHLISRGRTTWDALVTSGSADDLIQARYFGPIYQASDGYLHIHVKNYPRFSGTVPVHIMVAEAALQKQLPKGAIVHHFDRDPTNNLPTNLVICQDQAYHKLLHRNAEIVQAGGDPAKEGYCHRCSRLLPLADFFIHGGAMTGWCIPCNREYKKTYARRAKENKLNG